MVLLRDALGETLRGARTRQNRTLRDVSTAANVSLGYLSEVERGRKEASSELLASICDALDLELSDVLDTVSDAIRTDPGGVKVASNSPKRALSADRQGRDSTNTPGAVPRLSAGTRQGGAAKQWRIVLPYRRPEAPVR